MESPAPAGLFFSENREFKVQGPAAIEHNQTCSLGFFALTEAEGGKIPFRKAQAQPLPADSLKRIDVLGQIFLDQGSLPAASSSSFSKIFLLGCGWKCNRPLPQSSEPLGSGLF